MLDLLFRVFGFYGRSRTAPAKPLPTSLPAQSARPSRGRTIVTEGGPVADQVRREAAEGRITPAQAAEWVKRALRDEPPSEE